MRRSPNHKNRRSYESESEQESVEYSSCLKNRRPQPRFIKNQIEDIDTDVIVLNISRTQYSIVEEIGVELGWEIDTARKSQAWDVMWIDTHIEAHDLFKLNQHQKISHYPSIEVLTRKNLLAKSLMKMNKIFPKQFNYFPFTWNIPSEFTELVRYDAKIQEQNKQPHFYIYKPEAQAQGKGIKICETLESLDNKSGIVQIYINDPFLIEKLKFDLRIYVLIIGLNPVRIFIYDEGLGRFATSQYQKANSRNIKDNCMHLTNYAINKKNRNFIFNTSQKDMDKGHKRSLSAVYNYLENKGIDTDQLKDKIDDIIIKTLLVGEPMLKHTYNLSRSIENIDDVCFQILGFDIMINQNLEPILLQVNHTPSFKTDTPLDKFIKKNLIKDTFKLLNLSVERKKQIIEMKKSIKELRAQRKTTKIDEREKKNQREEKIKARDNYEEQNLGNFRKIYPSEDEGEKYKRIREESDRIFTEQNGLKNRVALRERVERRPNSLGFTKNELKKQSPIILEKPGITSSLQISRQKKATQMQRISLLELYGLKEKFPTLSLLKKQNQKMQSNMNSINTMNVQSAIFSKHYSKSLSRDRQQKIDASKIIFSHLKIPEKGSYLAPKIIGLDEIPGRKKKKSEDGRASPSPVIRKSVKKIGIGQYSNQNSPQKRRSIRTDEQKLLDYKNLIGDLIGNLNNRSQTINRNSKITRSRYKDEYLWRINK